MRITTKGRYGVRALVSLGRHGNGPLAISRIAAQERISPEFLEQIFFKLKKAGIIRSLRGPKGGFQLNRSIADITVWDVLLAVDEPLHPAPCVDLSARECPLQGECVFLPMWEKVGSAVAAIYDTTSFRDLVAQETEKVYEYVPNYAI